MKFSDHFFSYHLINPLGPPCYGICFGILFFFANMFTIPIVIRCLTRDYVFAIHLIAAISIPIVNIIMFILYKVLKSKIDYRIDCIYSKDFDRVFIGIVKYQNTKYANTFEFQMNNISRFILEKEGKSSDKTYILKVVFKNNETQRIFPITNKSREDLKGLAYLLNERLNYSYYEQI